MTSVNVQKRAKPQPTHPNFQFKKKRAELGSALKMLSTLISEISKSSFIVDTEYRIPPNPSLRQRKQKGRNLAAPLHLSVCDSHQFVRVENHDFFSAGFDDALPLPIAEQAADRI